MSSRPLSQSPNLLGIRAPELHVNDVKGRTNYSSIICNRDGISHAEIWFTIRIEGNPEEEALFCLKFGKAVCYPHSQLRLSLQTVLAALQRNCIMESASKPGLTPKERIDLIRAELESIKASTARNKWEMLALEMEDIKDDLTDEIQTGLKDSANMMGELGKRLSKLETQVEELTKALGKISEVTAEASSKAGR
jgi:site-specific recombinase XerC